MPATVTRDSHYCTCLGHLGWQDTDRIISIFCHAAQGGQGKYSSDCRVSLLLTILLTNFAYVNNPLKATISHSKDQKLKNKKCKKNEVRNVLILLLI